MTSIDAYAFYDCSGLTDVYYGGTEEQWNTFIVARGTGNDALTSVALHFGTPVYTVTYDANGGTGAPEAQTKTYGTALMLSETVPVRAGYTFLGWSENQDSTEAAYQPGGSFTVDADTTLYAVWLTPDFVLPSSLTTIEAEAFEGGAFRYVKLPETTETIGNRAFADCPNLQCVYIPEATVTIYPHAFDGVYGLTVIGVPGSTAEGFAYSRGFTFRASAG